MQTCRKCDSKLMSKSAISHSFMRRGNGLNVRMTNYWIDGRRGQKDERGEKKGVTQINAGSETEGKQRDNRKKKAGEILYFRCLTLPEGRLQFSRAVSTRFLSAENILKILRGQTKNKKNVMSNHSKYYTRHTETFRCHAWSHNVECTRFSINTH